MSMLRKITLAFAVAVMISVSGISHAAVKKDVPVLKACRIYQIGENEFVLSLSGKDIPLPECRTENDSLFITLNNSKIYHPKAIISSMHNTLDSIPLLHGFDAKNVSADGSYWGEITIDANFPLTVHSVQRSRDGYSLRVKSDVKSTPVFTPPPAPEKTAEIPLDRLPFSVDTRISLEIRDAELRDVIRGIMSYIGMNVIIDPSFPGSRNNSSSNNSSSNNSTVAAVTNTTNNNSNTTANSNSGPLLTMTMNDVRADEVLNYIMKAYDLACYKSGNNTLVFGSINGLYKLSGSRSVKQYKIHFAEPAQVSTMLRILATLDENAVTVDERMRSIYVRTNPAKMEEVDELVALLDTPQKQVMIKATIFEFNDSDSLAVQSALNIAYDDIMLRLGGSDGLVVNYRNDRSIMRTPAGWTDRVITEAFSTLEQNVKGKVLANPSVIATDGRQATINLTQDYPYVSDRDNDRGTVTWSTEEVGPQLTFTPRIGRDGYVTLTLNIRTGDVIGTQTSSTGEQMPVTTTRSVTTDVRVRDGMPFVIGGLFMEENGKNISRIPILGHIPLLGELFTFRSNTKTKSQVVMVITPYILDSD